MGLRLTWLRAPLPLGSMELVLEATTQEGVSSLPTSKEMGMWVNGLEEGFGKERGRSRLFSWILCEEVEG